MNIEQEMNLLWFMQNTKKMSNPHLLIFDGDGINIILKSKENYLIAYSELISDKGNCYLRMIYVPKESRGQGIATKVIGYLINDCKESGINAIETETENNSVNFFLKIGFNFMEGEENRMILNF